MIALIFSPLSAGPRLAESLQEKLATKDQEFTLAKEQIQTLEQERQQLEEKIRLLSTPLKRKWWSFLFK
jgi:predicted nuclease with TOPRIM domain